MRKRTVIFVILLSASLLTACGNTISISHRSVENQNEKIAQEQDYSTNEYDEVVSVVDAFWKAEMKGNAELASSFWEESLKDKIFEFVERSNAECESLPNEMMELCVWNAERLFSYSENYYDMSFLYEDEKVISAVNDYAAYIRENNIIYSLPANADMRSANEATVKVGLSARTEGEDSFADIAKGFFRKSVFQKLTEDSNFITEAIAKKLVKQSLIDDIEAIKRECEDIPVINLGSILFYLSKDGDNWLITNFEGDAVLNSYLDEYDEDEYDEDEYDEDEYNRNEEFENEYSGDEYDNDEYDGEIYRGMYMDLYDDSEDDDLEDEMMAQYILPYSDSEYLDESDLDDLSAEECRIARNEIYARHGRRFNDEYLQDYFDACPWYEGTIDPEDFPEEILNGVEKANLQTIAEYEEEMGY